jgi:hypothetical protein
MSSEVHAEFLVGRGGECVDQHNCLLPAHSALASFEMWARAGLLASH